ncbi:hypothetical protein [Pseudomonas spelaei]
MINGTSQAIGFLVLAAMDSKTRDVESVLSDFRRCLNHYDAWAERFFSFSALDVEQVFKVGDEVAIVAPSIAHSSPVPPWQRARPPAP